MASVPFLLCAIVSWVHPDPPIQDFSAEDFKGSSLGGSNRSRQNNRAGLSELVLLFFFCLCFLHQGREYQTFHEFFRWSVMPLQEETEITICCTWEGTCTLETILNLMNNAPVCWETNHQVSKVQLSEPQDVRAWSVNKRSPGLLRKPWYHHNPCQEGATRHVYLRLCGQELQELLPPPTVNRDSFHCPWEQESCNFRKP